MTAEIPRKPRWNMRDPEDDPFDMHKIYVPKSIGAKMQEVSDSLVLPVSRLFVIAADNALERADGFDLDLKTPDVPFTENAYAETAVKIFEFLRRFPGGTGIDTLWMFRREIGVTDRYTFMLGYRELIHSKMVEEFYPRNSKFRYSSNYRYVKCVGVKPIIKYKKPSEHA